MRGLHLRTDYAVVAVSLLPKDGDEGGGAGGSFDDALGDAGDLFVAVAGVIVRVLAVALPLGLIALVGWRRARLHTPPPRVRAGLIGHPAFHSGARNLVVVPAITAIHFTDPACPWASPPGPPTPGCAGASVTRSTGNSSLSG